MDQKQPTKLERVIEILIDQGATDDQIVEFTTELSQKGFSQMYTEALGAFTDEDLDMIDKIPESEPERLAAEVKRLYKERTDNDPEEFMKKFLDSFAAGFLIEYEKEQQENPKTKEELKVQKKEVEDELALALVDGVEQQKISFEESQEASRFILKTIDEVKTTEELISFLDQLVKKWSFFQDVSSIQTLKMREQKKSSQKLEAVKDQIQKFI